MKYFMVSDIHGEYDKLIDALTKAKFNKDVDTLVSVGDAFDRGHQNLKVLDYLLSLPHKILLWGNHDLRLKKLLLRQGSVTTADYRNGTIGTIEELGQFTWQISMSALMEADNENGKKLFDYFDQCYYALEFPNLYVTHAWLPNIVADFDKYYVHELIQDWRNCPKEMWYDATWTNSELMIADKCFPDKPILIGHWHAFRIAERYGEKRITIDNNTTAHVDTSMFVSPDGKVIAIDGATTRTEGQVNVYVYESDVDPIKY